MSDSIGERLGEHPSMTRKVHWKIRRPRKEDALRRLFSPSDTPQNRDAIAKHFKMLRSKSHMTQAVLGRMIGVCRQSINEIENRRVWLHYTTLQRFLELEERHERERATTASIEKFVQRLSSPE